MDKYSSELVNAYINGDDINNSLIEELENNSSFMMLVISKTNDKNFYNLCSDNVKKSFNFVKFIITKFKSDVDFISLVADYFLANCDIDVYKEEIAILMSEYTEGNYEKYVEYRLMCDVAFANKMVKLEIFKITVDNKKLFDQIGCGFYFIYDEFNSSDVVLGFYAKRFIGFILSYYEIDLEESIHESFKRVEDFIKFGKHNYLIDIISIYDYILSSYLMTHTELLSEYVKKIDKIIASWPSYDTKIERTKYTELLDRVYEYMKEYGNECSFTEMEVLYYIAKTLGIDEILLKYDKYMNKETYDIIIPTLTDDYFEMKLGNSFENRMHFNNIREMMISIIKGAKKKDNQDNSCKILEFRLKDKNIQNRN